MMPSFPRGFEDMVNLVTKDWDGPSPWDRLTKDSSQPIPHLTHEERIRWVNHVIKVGEEQLPHLMLSNAAAAVHLEALLKIAKGRSNATDLSKMDQPGPAPG